MKSREFMCIEKEAGCLESCGEKADVIRAALSSSSGSAVSLAIFRMLSAETALPDGSAPS